MGYSEVALRVSWRLFWGARLQYMMAGGERCVARASCMLCLRMRGGVRVYV
jgi:hypothetical protein